MKKVTIFIIIWSVFLAIIAGVSASKVEAAYYYCNSPNFDYSVDNVVYLTGSFGFVNDPAPNNLACGAKVTLMGSFGNFILSDAGGGRWGPLPSSIGNSGSTYYNVKVRVEDPGGQWFCPGATECGYPMTLRGWPDYIDISGNITPNGATGTGACLDDTTNCIDTSSSYNFRATANTSHSLWPKPISSGFATPSFISLPPLFGPSGGNNFVYGGYTPNPIYGVTGLVGYGQYLSVRTNTLSTTNWQAYTNPPSWMTDNPKKYDYAYWKDILLPRVPDNSTYRLGSLTLDATTTLDDLAPDTTGQTNYYYVTGDMTVDTDQTLTKAGNVIFLIDGNLTIKGTVSRANKSTFLAFFVGGGPLASGGIIVDKNLSSPDLTESFRNQLVSYWSMDDDPGTVTVADSKGANGGTSSVSTNVVGGKLGSGARSFAAVDLNRVTFTQNSSLKPTAALTISAWVNAPLNQANTWSFPISDLSVNSGGANSGWALVLYHYGSQLIPYFTAANTAGGAAAVDYGADIAGGWHQIVGVYDGANIYTYIDGKRVAGPVPLSGGISYGAANFSFGDFEPQHWNGMDGVLDEVGLWNRALNDTEIQNLFSTSNNNWVAGPGPTNHTPAINGLFLTDGQFSVPGTGGTDSQFIGSGTFIAYKGFVFERNLGNDPNTGNPALPAEQFIFDSSLVINAPSSLMQSSYSWQEITP